MSDGADTFVEYVGPVRLLPLEEQADLVESVGADTLLYCPDPWALRHRFVNRETGRLLGHVVTSGTVCIVALARSISGASWWRLWNPRCLSP